MDLSSLRTMILDLNGTLTRWDDTLLGTQNLIHKARQENIDLYFVTDNTGLNAEGWSKKLSNLGISTKEEKILTAGAAAKRKMSKESIKDAYVIGSEGLIDEVSVRSSQDSDRVILGLDQRFNYSKMRRAAGILQDGDLKVLSDQKKLLTSDGWIPHQKPLNDALANYAEPELWGKPSDTFTEYVRSNANFIPDATLLVGDRAADIRLGRKLGVKTALVTSGETTRDDIKRMETGHRPDFGVSNLSRLTKKL